MDAIKQQNQEYKKLLAEFEAKVKQHQQHIQASKRELNREIAKLRQSLSQQKQIIETLEGERQLLKAALKSIPAGIVIADSKSRRIIFSNNQTNNFWPTSSQAKQPVHHFHPQKAYRSNNRRYKANDWPIIRSLQSGEVVDKEEIRYVSQHNETAHMQVSSSAICNDHGKKIAAIEIFSDITKRKKTEQLQRETEEMHRNVFETAWNGIIILSPSGQFLECNPAFLEMVGYSKKELYKLKVKYVIHPDYREMLNHFKEKLVLNTQVNAEIAVIRKDGQVIPVEIVTGSAFSYHGQPALLTFARDLTENKQVEKQLRQHQLQLAHAARMNTLGEMTAGIAHEINQPLGAIVNYTRGCIRRLNSKNADPDALIPAITEVSKQAERAAQIILRLRRFAKKGEMKQTETDINEVVRESISFLQPEISQHDIILRKKMSRTLVTIQADKIQLEQVVVNVIKNAIDALSTFDTDQRRIYIQTSMPNEADIEILIHDFGPGFKNDELSHIFQPFFTTKEEGLGVGLAISQTIIEAHGGRITATPPPKEGACFRITLPINNEPN
ncbi:MAG: PAS domain S-box protein [Coxiellaceae bacterium]|nr:PAS domain S-box protein [Coxiellaceae bacterium]